MLEHPLFQPYAITQQGRIFHGNVSLADHHLVARDGAYTLFRVADLVAMPISPALALTLSRLMPGPGRLIPDALMRLLRELRLVPPAPPDPSAEPASTAAPPAMSPANAAETPNRPAPARPHPVVNIALFLTQTCNLRCVYCYGQGGEYGHQGVMTWDTARAAVDWLMDNSLDAEQVHIGFFGGEPLLNFPLLQQVVSYAKAQAATRGKRVAFNMTTNATRLTDKIIAYLKAEDINPLISCDGPPALQDRQRPFKNGRGSYQRLFANVQKLRQVFPDLTARATLRDNADPAAIRQGLAAVGFTTQYLSRASPVILAGARAAQTAQQPDPDPSDDRFLADQRAEVSRLFAAVNARNLTAHTAPLALALVSSLVTGQQRQVACGVGRGLAGVSVSGEIYPCHRFVGLAGARLGHLHDYRAGKVNDYHRAVVDNLPVCRGCWARYLCGGGCFYDNQARTGDHHRPDDRYCREMKTVCEDLIHGWGALPDADRDYLRNQVETLLPAERL